MKFAILALFGLVAIQAVELPTSDELVEIRHRRVEQDEEPVEKKRHGRKHRRADEDVMISFFGAPANQKRERNRRKCLEGWYAHQSIDPYSPYVNGAC